MTRTKLPQNRRRIVGGRRSIQGTKSKCYFLILILDKANLPSIEFKLDQNQGKVEDLDKKAASN